MGSSSGSSSKSSGGSKSTTSPKNSTGLGITTGKTMYGNTAYGPAGGKATGYATATTDKSTGKTTYSNYRTPEGGKANVSYAGSGGAGNTVSKATKNSKQNITPAGVTYKKPAPAAPVKPKAPATRSLKAPVDTKFQNLQAGYNYQYPKGMSAGNYMLNPTDQPAKRGPSGSGLGTVTTKPKNNREAPGYSVQKQNNMGMAKGGMVPGAKKAMAPMAKKGSKPMSKPVGKMGMMAMMAKKPKR
jgi:hypothetical protein